MLDTGLDNLEIKEFRDCGFWIAELWDSKCCSDGVNECGLRQAECWKLDSKCKIQYTGLNQ